MSVCVGVSERGVCVRECQRKNFRERGHMISTYSLTTLILFLFLSVVTMHHLSSFCHQFIKHDRLLHNSHHLTQVVLKLIHLKSHRKI